MISRFLLYGDRSPLSKLLNNTNVEELLVQKSHQLISIHHAFKAGSDDFSSASTQEVTCGGTKEAVVQPRKPCCVPKRRKDQSSNPRSSPYAHAKVCSEVRLFHAGSISALGQEKGKTGCPSVALTSFCLDVETQSKPPATYSPFRVYNRAAIFILQSSWNNNLAAYGKYT